MTPRIVHLAAAAALLLGATPAAAQEPAGAGALQPFASDRELIALLREAEARHPPPAPCTHSVGVSAAPGGPGAASRPAVVRGRVHAAGGDGLANAIVQVAGLNLRTLTDSAGGYRLVIPPERLDAETPLRLGVSLLGWNPASQAVALAPGDSAAVEFGLCKAELTLGALTVTAAGVGESVTNVQHAGADEGGIVKVHGDHLVMLRRGRLFTVSIAGGRLRPVAAVAAYEEGIDGRGTWYDEMLVSGETVVVIGYSYARGGTEIGLFHIGADGTLTHRSTYHLRSNDYYSSRNYASRLVDGKLVFYTPLRLRPWAEVPEDDASSLMPQMRRWRAGASEAEWRPIATSRRIYAPPRPLGEPRSIALHTVTVCDLGDGELDCQATGVLGPYGHTFYVSPGAVYVWLSGWRARGDGGRPAAMAYRMPLDGSAPGALGVHGSPVDQFSFLESDDRHLNVLVRERAGGQWMWTSEHGAGDVALLRVPLTRFGDGGDAAAPADYRQLPTPPGASFHNRFVGGHLLYGTGSGWGAPRDGDLAGLYVVDWRRGRVSWLATGHPVDRIEALGAGAVVVGADPRRLHLSSVRLGAHAAIVDRYTLENATQGELRSHGFFYRPDGTSGGVLGLPVRGGGRAGSAHLRHGSASILYLRARSLRFAELGSLAAREGRHRDDGCVASCVDWYGNARPLFLRGRIFALMGYELVEGEERQGRIREVRRVDYTPAPPRVAAGGDD
jgi:hypothetical protein